MMLISHLNAIEHVLLAQSIAAQNAGHPNLRGGPREWFVHDFLQSHLPTILEIGQGEIIDENSVANPPKGSYRNQVDLVIYRRDLPKIIYSPNNAAFLAEGVKATIECKSGLTKSDLLRACKASKVHKSLIRSTQIREDKIISYVVAYDCATDHPSVAGWLPDIEKELGSSADELVDMIIILGKGIIWRISSFPDFPIDTASCDSKWVFVEQNSNNLYTMFTHMLSWVTFVSPPPDIKGYVLPLYFKKYETI